MRAQLLPASLVHDSLEVHLGRHGRQGSAVYLTAVALLLAGVASLPLVRVPVSVASPGVVRPATEKHELVAPASGVLARVLTAERQRVEEGDVLLLLRDQRLEERGAAVRTRAAELAPLLADLRLLAGAADPALLPVERLRSDRYRRETAQLRSELRAVELRVEQAGRSASRGRALAERGLGPWQEVEERELELAQARAAGAVLLERYATAWQGALLAHREEARGLRARAAELHEERALHRVHAPVAGTVEELAALSPGSYLRAGERVGVISPLAPLVAEVYVAPRDIGLVRVGEPVRLLVDAFPHHDWGFVSGRVREIGGDFVVLEGRPVFRVRVSMERSHLALRSGVRGELRKGMTLRAHFLLAERTLWQLLRDDAADWLDPTAG